jgi:hypothetical protein
MSRNRKRFPPSTWAFATAPWHHDYTDPRALHDSTLRSLSIVETPRSRAGASPRIEIRLSLFGAYRDGYLLLRYVDVLSYQLPLHSVEGHPDLYRDEVRLSRKGNPLHEIEWLNRGRDQNWLIECKDVKCRWQRSGI